MSNVITLDHIVNAVNTKAPDASPEVKGHMVAKAIKALATPVKATPKPKAVKTASKPKANLVATKSGGMMSADKGSITKGQIKTIRSYEDRHGFDGYTDAAMATWSMAFASDFYFDMKAIVKAEA